MAEATKARKAMIKIKPKKYKVGDTVKVDFIAIHPMETGMAKDKKSGEIKPAHYIEDITFAFDGEAFTKMKVWESISTNPYFSVNYKVTKKGKITVAYKDNQGEEVLKTKKVKPKEA